MAGVIQAVWGSVAAVNGERVNLQNLHNGTFRHNATGRLFTADGNIPGIFHLQVADAVAMNEGQEVHEEEDVAAEGHDMEEAPVPGPLRAAFANARITIETHIQRALTEAEWDVIADHGAAAIQTMRGFGLNPLTELSGPNGASCIPTSDWIYALLGTGARTGHDNTTAIATRLAALAASIENEAANSIYQVVFNQGHHGFVIVIVGDLAEVTQSFANSESLGTNLQSENFTFTRAEVAGHLGNFLNDEETNDAQVAMFEGRIDGGADNLSPIANMELSWNRSALRADAAAAIQAELNSRRGALLENG
jgi:hypothetical protein